LKVEKKFGAEAVAWKDRYAFFFMVRIVLTHFTICCATAEGSLLYKGLQAYETAIVDKNQQKSLFFTSNCIILKYTTQGEGSQLLYFLEERNFVDDENNRSFYYGFFVWN